MCKDEGVTVPDIEFTQEDLPDVWLFFMVMPKIADRLESRSSRSYLSRFGRFYCGFTQNYGRRSFSSSIAINLGLL
jgi:hypothetical protein